MLSSPTLPPALVGILLAIFSLIALLFACRKAKGQLARLVCSAIGAFFTVAGVFIFLECGKLALSFAMTGGTAWFPAVTLGCCALVGAIFTGVFGYLLTRILNRPLCFGLAYLALIPVMVGSYLNYTQAVQAFIPIIEKQAVKSLPLPDGDDFPLEFELTVNSDYKYEPSAKVEIVAARHKSVTHLELQDDLQEGNVNLRLIDGLYADGVLLFELNYRPGRLWLMMGNILFFASLLLTLKYRSTPAPNTNTP